MQQPHRSSFRLRNDSTKVSFTHLNKLVLHFFLLTRSFFEKISTGNNTDSDLRVVRFDQNGMMLEPATTNCSTLNDFDEMPKFKMPVPSEKQQVMQSTK